MAAGSLLGCLAAAGIWAHGCGSPQTATKAVGFTSGSLVLDLARTLPAADVTTEVAQFEMGNPAVRSHLISGWSRDEEDAAGPFVWSLGASSTLDFFATAPVQIELGISCQPLEFPDAPTQRVTVHLNQHPIGDVPLHSGLGRYQIELPASRVVAGSNRLDFGFSSHHRPVEVIPGALDPRELAVKWRGITLDGLSAGRPPRINPDVPQQLEVSAGTELAYYFALEAPGDFVAAASTWGPRGEDLELVAEFATSDGQAETRRFAVQSLDQPIRWQLPAGEGTIARLLLKVTGQRDDGPWGWLRQRLGRQQSHGLTLTDPKIHVPAETVEATLRPAPTPRPNVIIYLIDTLRADHLGTYGYSRPTSPQIDRFAQDAAVFLDARAPSSWTRPAVASLFTGLNPRRHGVNGRQEPLARELDTLAEILAGAGYDTAGFVTNGNVAPTFAFDQGFASYRYLRESGDTHERHQLSDRLNGWAFDWLARRDSPGSPFFLYLHATDPHAPYVPPEPFRQRFAPGVDPQLGWLSNVREIFSGQRSDAPSVRQGLIDLYDAEIAFNDEQFGKLLDHLRQLDLYDNSLILLLSDHGEEFLDHGNWEHGKTLFAEQLDVPLILKLPGGAQAGDRISGAASHADVLPTILELLGMPSPADLDGTSLLAGSHRPRRTVFSHLALARRDVRAVTSRGFKLILDRSSSPHGDPVQLYDLADDRGETRQLAAQHPFEKAYLYQLLRRRELELAGDSAAGENIEIPEDLRRQLEALGYL